MLSLGTVFKLIISLPLFFFPYYSILLLIYYHKFLNVYSFLHQVALSFMSDGISLKETTSEFSCSYTRFQSGTTKLLQNNSRVMPLQLTPTNREAKVLKYREKRKARKFEKKIRYASRKAYAETRPRVRGRFARRTDIELEEDQLFSIEEYGYAIVPSCWSQIGREVDYYTVQ